MPYNYKHTIRRYRNETDWIEEDTWAIIPRVSDVINALVCDWTAYDNDVNRVQRGEIPLEVGSSNIYSLGGTLAHYEIYEFICDLMGIEPDPNDLTEEDKKLQVKMSKSNELGEMHDRIGRSFDNFLKWWDRYNPRPVFPEKQIVHIEKTPDGMVDVTKSLKGTVDFVAEFDVDRMSKNALIELKEYGDIQHDKFVALVDWKTGRSERPSHQLQLTGYDYLSAESGYFDEILNSNDFCNNIMTVDNYGLMDKSAMCVKLGGSSYTNTVYSVESKREFFRAWDRFNSPSASTYSEKQKEVGRMKDHCVFCPHKFHNCPIFEYK